MAKLKFKKRKTIKLLFKFIIFFYKNKIKIFILCICLMLIILLIIISVNLFSVKKNKDSLIYFNSSQINDSYNDSNNFTNNMITSFKESTYSEYASTTSYYVFGMKNKNYMKFFKDISDTEWKYFVWFHLGNYWYNKWENNGPIEQLARTSLNSQKIYQIKNYFWNSSDYKTTDIINNFINKLDNRQIFPKNKNAFLGNLKVKTTNITYRIIKNGQLINAPIGSSLTDIENNPLSIAIHDGKISIVLGLITYNQLSRI